MMRISRWETYVALLGVVLASLSVVNIAGRPRPVLALVAIALILLVAYIRLRAQFGQVGKKQRPTFDAYERALRIQEERERRYWHR